MEADLQRFHGIDYRDRWRGDLTLRRVCVLLRHLPPDSACASLARDGKTWWPLEAHLLDDLRMVLVGSKKKPAKPHPQRPKGKKKQINRKRLAAARRRRAERKRALADGEIT